MLIHTCTLVTVPPEEEKQSKTPHSHPSTQSVRRSATAETVSIDHLKQNAGTICPNHSVRFGEFKP